MAHLKADLELLILFGFHTEKIYYYYSSKLRAVENNTLQAPYWVGQYKITGFFLVRQLSLPPMLFLVSVSRTAKDYEKHELGWLSSSCLHTSSFSETQVCTVKGTLATLALDRHTRKTRSYVNVEENYTEFLVSRGADEPSVVTSQISQLPDKLNNTLHF